MKNNYLAFTLPFLFLVVFMSSCEKEAEDEPETNDPKLHIEFMNSSDSEYTINVLQIRAHGKAGEASSPPIGDWSGDILQGELAPGSIHVMDLAIPNLHWSEYRLGVIDGDGNSIMLHEQAGWTYDDAMGTYGPPITHWGSDKRLVYVTLKYNQSVDRIIITGWGDNAN